MPVLLLLCLLLLQLQLGLLLPAAVSLATLAAAQATPNVI